MTRYQCCEHCAEVGGTSFCGEGHLSACFWSCANGNRTRVQYLTQMA